MRVQVLCFCFGIRHRSNTRFNACQGWILAITVVVAGCLLAGVPAEAQRREFAATYQVSGIAQSGDEVIFTLALKIVNNSGQSLRNAGIVLYGHPAQPMQEGPVLGTFPLIKSFPDRGELQVSETFTVPVNEYLRWNRGNQPRLVFLKPDSAQGTILEPIDLSPELGGTTAGKAKLAGGAR